MDWPTKKNQRGMEFTMIERLIDSVIIIDHLKGVSI